MSGHTKGPWHASVRRDAVVADAPISGHEGADEIEFYGGYLVAESISQCDRPAIIAVPAMLAALKLVKSVRPENWDDEDDAEQVAAWRAVDEAIALAERDVE